MGEVGHQAEDFFAKALTNLGVKEVRPGEKPDDTAFRRATETEDREGTDFFLFVGDKNGGWIPIDLTTATDPRILNDKRRRAEAEGIEVLEIPTKTLRLAAGGSVKDLEKVRRTLVELVGRKH